MYSDPHFMSLKPFYMFRDIYNREKLKKHNLHTLYTPILLHEVGHTTCGPYLMWEGERVRGIFVTLLNTILYDELYL